MKRIFTIMAVMAVVLSVASCKKDNDNAAGSKPGTENNGTGNGGSGNGDGSSDDTETINSTLRYGYLENYGVWYDEQPEDVNNWVMYLSANEFDEDGWSYDGDLVMIELFSEGADAPKVGKYTIDAFYESYYSDFSVGDGYVEEGEEDGETVEYCMGTWLFQDGYGYAAALSGEVEIQKSGEAYTVTYDFSDDEYGIVFKGTFTGELEVYDYSDEVSLSSTKSGDVRKEKRMVYCAGFRK